MHFHPFPTDYAFSSLSIQTLAIAAALFFLGIIALIREKASHISVVYFILTMSLTVWLFSFSRMYDASDADRAMWWARAAYFGITSIPAALYHFSAVILQDYDRVRKKVLGLWLLSAGFIALTMLTDMQFRSLYRYSWGFYPRFSLTSAPFCLYFFASMTLSLMRFVSATRAASMTPRRKSRARTLLICVLAGSIGIIDFLPAFGIPFYPFGYLGIYFFVVVSAYSIVTYRFMAITPAFAAQQIIDTMNDVLIVLDPDRIVRLVNHAACSLFGRREQDLIGEQLSKSITNHGDFMRQLEAIFGAEVVRNREIEYLTPENELRTLTLSTSVMKNTSGERLATVCVAADITERKRAETEREGLITKLQEALAKVKRLSGMLPICASCKKIRDDKGYWSQLEMYISEHSEALFTHGLCPNCAQKILAELDSERSGPGGKDTPQK